MLYGEQIRREIIDGVLVLGYPDLEAQLQHSGLDLTLAWVDVPVEGGYEGWIDDTGDVSGAPHQPMNFDDNGWLYLAPGAYRAACNEVLVLPEGMTCKSYGHWGLTQCGVEVVPGMWAGGFNGRIQTLLVVHHRMGFKVKKGAHLLHMTFDYHVEPSRRFSNEVLTLGNA